MYDRKTGEDLLPKIRKIVKEKGFLPQDAEQRDKSWQKWKQSIVQHYTRLCQLFFPKLYLLKKN